MKDKQRAEIYKANQDFYNAFESLDIAKMEKAWLKESYIQCFHPGWEILRGWEAVMESWRRIFENTQKMHFVLTEVQVEIREPLAWVTLYENLTSRSEKQTGTGLVLATNIFERRPEGWFMIHHHGSIVMKLPERPGPATVH
jgi:ketosteroid isomerase-like protein